MRIESEMISENPNMPDARNMYHYKCVLKHKRKQMTVYFSMGYGHCSEPTVEDVLSCMFLDSYAEHSSFEEWCSDLGYDDDSRKAERVYNACLKNAKKLRNFFKTQADYEYWQEKLQDY